MTPALNVVSGGFGLPGEVTAPAWPLKFPADWGKAAAEIAAEQWQIVTSHMRAAGTLGTENTAAIEIYSRAFARWRIAEAHVAEHGPIVPAPRTGVPMHNPYLAVANAAAATVLKAGADLGLPPSMRGRVGRANGTKKRASASDAYLGRTPAS